MKDYMSTLNALKKEQQNVPIYCTLYDDGCLASINTHLIIGNESHEANEVVWMAMAIVDLMLEQMEREPYDAISISALCREAGVSRPTFYSLFGSKDDVVSFLLREDTPWAPAGHETAWGQLVHRVKAAAAARS